MAERPRFEVIKGPERDGNVIPLFTQKRMFIVEGADGLTHLVPHAPPTHRGEEMKYIPFPDNGYKGRQSAEMSPWVPQGTVVVEGPFREQPPYELLGTTGLEERIFEADLENPAMGHEGRGFPRDPDDAA